MSWIKEMEMQGFKSFANKTKIVFNRNLSVIVGPNGSGKCVSGDTLITMGDGSLIRIDELVNKKVATNGISMEDGLIAPGDGTKALVLGKDTKIHEKVIQAFVKRTAPDKLLTIQTRSGRKISATPYHPLFHLKNGKVEAIQADELKEGIRIAVPRMLPIKEPNKTFYELLDLIQKEDNIYVPWSTNIHAIVKERKGDRTWREIAKSVGVSYYVVKGLLDKQAINFAHLVKLFRFLGVNDDEITANIPAVKSQNSKRPTKIPWQNNPELSRLLGYLLAEGRFPPKSDQIWFTNSDEKLVDDYTTLIKSIFDIHTTINEYKPNTYDVLSYSSSARVILERLGMGVNGTINKKITNVFFTHAGKKELAELLNGLYSGDGYVSPSSIEIVTKSPALAIGIENALLCLGLNPRRRNIIKTATNSGFTGEYINIILYGVENFIIFHNNIKLMHENKSMRIEKLITKKANTNIDLLEVSELIKNAVHEQNIKIKPLRKKFPILDAYAYNQCMPSRMGVQQLVKQVFKSESATALLLDSLSSSDIFWDEISSIEEVDKSDQWVYDLCIEDDHNFIANNIFVHNSNICDSLLFVLGHVSKKEMRTEKLDHLIFNGGKTDNPAKFARVSITLDNSEKDFPFDTKEVVISRAVDRKGTSIYRLNGERVTKGEITNVLDYVNIKSDGFNIILQGAIARFVELHSAERKALIEELSGISSFDDKKKKSTAELEGVQEKIKEVAIVLKEKERHLKELLTDKISAEKFVKLGKKKRHLEGQVVLKNIGEFSHMDERLRGDIEEKNAELLKIAEGSKGLSDAITALENEKKDLGIEIEKRGEKESIKLNKEIEDLRISLTNNEQQIESKKNELKKMSERKKQVKEEIEDNQKKLLESQKEQTKLEMDLEKITDEINKISSEVDKNKHIEEVFETRKKIDDITLNVGRLNAEIDSALKNENVLEQQNKIETEIKRMKAKRDNIEPMLSKEKRLGEHTKEKISEVEVYIDHLIKKIAQLEERKNVYKEMLDEGTKEILKLRDSGKVSGVYGTFTEICNIPNRYSKAFRAAAGENINTVMVEDSATARKCIDYLKHHKLGVARFLPIKNLSVKKTKIKPTGMDVIDFASSLVGTDAKFKDAVEWILDDTLIVDRINASHESEVKVVSIEGDFVHNKIFSGGHRSDVITFKDENIEAEYQSAVADMSKYRSYKERLIEQAEKNKTIIEQLVEDITTVKNRLNELEMDYSKLRGEYKDENIDVKKNKAVIHQLEKQKYKLEELMYLRASSLSAESAKQVEKKLKDMTENKNTFIIKLNTMRAESKNVTERDIEKLEKISDDIIKTEDEFKRHISELEAEVHSGKEELKQKYEGQKMFFKSLKDITNRRENVIKSIDKNKAEIFRFEKKTDGINKDVSYLNLKKAEIIGKLEGLKHQFKEFEQEGIEPPKSGLEMLEKEFEEARKMLQNFGPVNMKALETYKIVEDEFNLLKEKVTVLETERQRVLDMIENIENKKLGVFMETFNHISGKFAETFALLSENGQANLILENKDNPLEGGIDMIARPAGKKLTSISALSGGEKTLVTLSFLFAIQEYHPAPFYVLDEIDSALDKTNSERLSDLVRAYSKRAQFIIISHNDELVSAADYLYGVSMKENAVSQIMSIKLPPMEGK